MPNDLLLKWLRLESNFATEIAQDAKTEANDHGIDRFVAESLVGRMRALSTDLRQSCEKLWKDQVRERMVDQWQATGEAFLEVLDALVAATEELAALGLPLQGVQSDIEQLRQEHKDRWPWFHKNDVEQALAESERGETLEVDEAFARIAGVSREEWVRRLEEHLCKQGGT